MRKIYLSLGLLVAVSMVLSACAVPTAPPAEVQKETVVVTSAPETVVVTSTPDPNAVEPTAEPATALNPYIGSNKLDGQGIPPTFFDDVHIRKAFAYCFDWDTVINEIWQGEAVQSRVLPLAGMPGYDPEAPVYTMDLEKCAEEFKLADVDKDGIPAGEDTDDVWSVGFRLQMAFNTGNTTRQKYAEILQANLAEVNELFVLEVLGIPWPAYLAAQRAHKLPMMTAGWQEDIHDAHNWYQPYTTGTYGARQNMPDDLKAEFKALLDQGVALTDPAERAVIYKQMNQLYYDQVPGILIDNVTSHGYSQPWVQGRILNPLFAGGYYKTYYKEAPAKDLTTFVSASIGDIDTFDPALAYDTASGEIIQNVYESLVFYDGEATDKFVPQLAESWTTSDDGTVWTFNIRKGVKFHEGGDLTPSDVAYSFQRGLLQGGYSSPQWMWAEPFFGVGKDDISVMVDEGASADDREALIANDPAKLKSVCEDVMSKIVADDAAGTVTFTLAQGWGPMLPTLAQSWGSVMDKEWVIEKGGWDGSCDTWQNFYAMTAAEDIFTPIANGTGPFKLESRTPGEEIVLAKNADYWGEPAKLDKVILKQVAEFGTRFSMLQAGDADVVYVPPENRTQVDPLVAQMRVFDMDTLTYKEPVPICSLDNTKLGAERFVPCADGANPAAEQTLILYIGRPSLSQDVLLMNFLIQ